MADAQRIRKAYAVMTVACPTGLVTYAQNARAARARVISNVRDAWDCSFRDALREVGRAHRWPHLDIHLPPRHPLAATLSEEVLHCVVHAYGGTGLRAGYRYHFYTSADDWVMQAALYHCLFKIHRIDKSRNHEPDMIMYVLTALGRNVAAGEVKIYPEHD